MCHSRRNALRLRRLLADDFHFIHNKRAAYGAFKISSVYTRSKYYGQMIFEVSQLLLVDQFIVSINEWNIEINEVVAMRPIFDTSHRYDRIVDRKSTRLNSSHRSLSRMPSSA